ncbi:MAG: serine/threonine-protein kinase [Coleofasciculus sp. B1-GNL1-01]|uniref:pentapeptide repeat-containing protein n=1 Tax=Coleofasciculus sp. B1-GNL1-01 TaxID=3068484 RepID=UPI0032F1C224
MSNYPDFDQYGYHVIQELGRNREAGRITYLATALNQKQKVVIKEFRFALADASWSGYKAYQREIEVLQQLDHPRIPRYLDSFETPQGFCLVQEYKNAPSLAERRSFTPQQIKQIAVSVLEILVYLQQRVPPIIHRDIKPENILVDKHLNVYLVDFGFARIRGKEMALSSVAAGTPGFMPPEEQFGRSLTESADLYSLGVTLIGLLTGTRSLDIGKLIDDNYRFDFKGLVPQLNPGFIAWLDKMVAPNVKQRFDNAATALDAIKSKQWDDKANRLESVVSAIKGRKLTYVLGLATLGIVALVGTTIIVPQPDIVPQSDRQVRQLLERNECVRCNLQGANLRAANLRDANLEGANLRDANLKYANLAGVNLSDAILEDAILENTFVWGANLSIVNLRNAKLINANLGLANLRAAKLENANLGRANLGGVDLTAANLESAFLGHTHLLDAKLLNANLKNASLLNANLGRANLENANLRDVNLENAFLRDANLKSANLEDVNLRNADLGNANLKDAHLEGANLEGVNLKDAIMPDGTKHP